MLDTPQACTGFGTRAVGAPGPEGPLVMGAPSAVAVQQFLALLLSRYSSLPESAWLAPTCGAGCVIIASILQVRTTEAQQGDVPHTGVPPSPPEMAARGPEAVGAFTCSLEPPRRAALGRCACLSFSFPLHLGLPAPLTHSFLLSH